MNRKQSPAPDPSQQKRTLWLKVALGVCLVLLLGWLNIWMSGGIAPAGKRATDRPANSYDSAGVDRKSPVEKRDRKSADHRNSDSASNEDADATENSQQFDFADGESARETSLLVRNVRVTNEDGEVVYRGNIDLKPTLDRIEQGERLRFSHDGLVFENHERHLPSKPKGYYHEFVLPTKGEDGPGGQRVVIGREGEVFYTPDHYHTFRRVR